MEGFRPRQQMRHPPSLQRPHHLASQIDLAVVPLPEQHRDIALADPPSAFPDHPGDERRNRLRQRLRHCLLGQPPLVRLRNRMDERAPKRTLAHAHPPRFRSFLFQTQHSRIVECLERNDNSLLELQIRPRAPATAPAPAGTALNPPAGTCKSTAWDRLPETAFRRGHFLPAASGFSPATDRYLETHPQKDG